MGYLHTNDLAFRYPISKGEMERPGAMPQEGRTFMSDSTTPSSHDFGGNVEIILFKNGKPVHTMVGAAPKAKIKQELESVL